MKIDFVELVLTCGSWQEAQRIADVVLEKGLVAGVEMMAMGSKEIKLIMKSLADNFDKVEVEVRKLHSHDDFVIQKLPLVCEVLK